MLPQLVAVVLAMNALALQQGGIAPAAATQQAQLLSYQWKKKI